MLHPVLDVGRAIRKAEVLLWNHDLVREHRRKLTFRAYLCLGVYTMTATWINLCYVFAYDTPTTW